MEEMKITRTTKQISYKSDDQIQLPQWCLELFLRGQLTPWKAGEKKMGGKSQRVVIRGKLEGRMKEDGKGN